jgi:hypothetical protein
VKEALVALVAELERGIPEEDLLLTRDTLRRMFRNLTEQR